MIDSLFEVYLIAFIPSILMVYVYYCYSRYQYYRFLEEEIEADYRTRKLMSIAEKLTEEKPMIKYETTGVSTDGTSTSYSHSYSSYCAYRLPCGYCKELGRQCPHVNTSPTITWTTNDCQSIEVNHG